MSICPQRKSPYGEDLRWRIVWQRVALRLGIATVGRNLGVDASTVKRVVNLFERTGCVAKKPYPKDARPNKKLSNVVQFTILHSVLQKPGIYFRELQTEICVLTGVEVSISSLCKFLHQSNFTRQRMAKQRNEEVRQQFAIDVSLYHSNMIIFIDETGSDRRDTIRRYGHSLIGRPPRSFQLLIRGERLSAITAMNCEGIQCLKVVRGTVDGDTFTDFVQRDLLPILMPFDGKKPNSVVILDNCSVHHVSGIVSMITQVGALIHFLPPYSPDLTPIEECFSKVKCLLKSMDPIANTHNQQLLCFDLESLALAAFSCITPDDCKSWIADSKVYNL